MAELDEALFASGAAASVVDTWVEVLTSQAADLVDPDTVTQEAAVITAIIGNEA